jgi:antitoxin (DNA-binding transcriptional repressor) of toxin-antitoxin stability system
MKASAMDLRYRTKEVLRALEANEEVVLTHRGNKKGTIVPVAAESSQRVKVASHEAIGMWADEVETVAEKLARIRKPRGC